MPNDYSGTKKVRALNGDQFLKDFRAISTIVAFLPAGTFLEVGKQVVWREALRVHFTYKLSNSVYANGRTVMVLFAAGPK